MNIYVYAHTYVHAIPLVEKMSMNLKKSKKDCEKVWRKKGKEKSINFIIISKSI